MYYWRERGEGTGVSMLSLGYQLTLVHRNDRQGQGGSSLKKEKMKGRYFTGGKFGERRLVD